MPTATPASINNLKQALAIAEEIQKLEAELQSVLTGSSAALTPAANAAPVPMPGKRGGKRKMSAATIAKMRASQQARWAKKKIGVVSPLDTLVKSSTKLAKKAKRNLSPEGRARIVAALKARWAAKKKAQK